MDRRSPSVRSTSGRQPRAAPSVRSASVISASPGRSAAYWGVSPVRSWASTFVASLLYGLEPRDPATLVFAAAVLGGVGAFAGWLPARAASRIDPAEVLRDA